MKRIKSLFVFAIILCAILCVGLLFGCKKKVAVDSSENQNYTVSYLVNEGGSISGLTTQTIKFGEDSEGVVAIPKTGYQFVKWSDGVDTAERTDRNVSEDINVTALFDKLSYAVKYETDGNGHIEGKAIQTVDYNESATKVTAIPNTGYQFVKWSDGVDTAERTDKNINESKTITAIFDKIKFTITYTAGLGGTIDGEAEQVIEYGEEAVFVVAVPQTGYKFVKWSDGNGSTIRRETNVISEISVTAEFKFLYAGGDGSALNPFTIENYAQLNDIWYYPDAEYKLIKDLDLSGILHEPIFDDMVYFKGRFNGDGHTISNLTVETELNYPSLFGVIGGIVGNLSFVNANIKTCDFNTTRAGQQYCVGIVAGKSAGLIYNVRASGIITVDGITYDGVAIGGIAGIACNTVSDCSADIQMTVKNVKREHETNMWQPFLFGGLLGVCDSAHIRNCNTQGEINIIDSCYDIYVGGFIGYYFTDRQVYTEIKNSHSNITITDNNSYCNAGGLIGRLEIAQNTSLKVTDCWVKGNIISGDVGGFIYDGFSNGELLIENCYVDNEINVFSDAAGFINRFTNDGGTSTIKGCSALNVLEVVNQSGAAWGFAYQVSGINIIDCFSSGSVSAARGGGFGWALSRCYVERCYSDSKVETVFAYAAFVYALINSQMVNCYSRNNFINEPIQNENIPISVMMHVRNSKLNNFYYSGNLIEKVFKEVTNSEIINCHCLKNDMLTDELIEVDRGDIPSSIDITIYERQEVMYNIAEKLNYGLSEIVWVNQDNDFPKFKII